MARRVRGLTLIEVVVATIILTLLLFSLGVLIPMTQVKIRNTSHHDLAVTYAENMMEKIRAMPFDYIIVPGDFYSPTAPAQPSHGWLFPPVPPYPTDREVSLKLYSGDPRYEPGRSLSYAYHVITWPGDNPDLINVEVSVYWIESSGGGGSSRTPKCVTLSSVLYWNGRE